MIQILHRGSPGLGHWLTISNLNCQEGTVNVFDSFYNDIDKESKFQIANILKPTGKNIKFNIIPVQRQAGGTEYGLFAIAFAVALGLGFNPTKLLFKQESMRGHLIDCLTKQEFSNFPFSINTNWRKKKTVIIRENIFFCICRGLYDSEMVQCTSCSEWFHFRCLEKQTAEKVRKNPDYAFKCNTCIAWFLS